jgi:hypothetical protein
MDQPASGDSQYLQASRQKRGGVLIHGIWQQKGPTSSLMSVSLIWMPNQTSSKRHPMKVLASHERKKKHKYLEPCLEQFRHFSPFVVSTDGLIGKEAHTMLKKLSARLAEKPGKPYSVVCGYENARLSSDSYLIARLQCPNQPDEQLSAAVGRWSRPDGSNPQQELHVQLLTQSTAPS